MHDFSVFIGRFQPLHIGHEAVIREALRQSKTLILLIGSADSAPSVKNPFSLTMRTNFIRAAFPEETASERIIIRPVYDRNYNDQGWIAQVQQIVTETILDHGNSGGPRLHGTNDFSVALAGFAKDGSSYYLKMFPHWGEIAVNNQISTFNATDVRTAYFRRMPVLPRDVCSPGVIELLTGFRMSEEFRWLVAEAEAVEAYRRSWGETPYPPVFVTADAVVVQSGHILLVERGDHPGKGQLALPGGFVNAGESIRRAVLRELKEEANPADARGDIPADVLASFIDDRRTRVFDHPDRDPRGRFITHAHLFRFPDKRKLYRVKGGDDARSAFWMKLADLDPTKMFIDHHAIIDEMIGL